MGILHTKIVGAAIMMGPDWRMKEVFEQVSYFSYSSRTL